MKRIVITLQERREAGDNFAELLKSRGYRWDRLLAFYRNTLTGELIYDLTP